jgi:ubiquinone/menaquinone biosynthesis C-methylase UbiE
VGEHNGAGPAMKLNLGCGHNKLGGFVNVDHSPTCSPDVCMNLEDHSPWPWEDGSIHEIVAHHILEHVNDFRWVTRQIYRVLKVGGTVDVRVPHPRSDTFLGDPTHVRPIVPGTLQMCSRKVNAMYRAEGWPNTPLGEQWGVDLELRSVSYTLEEKWRKLVEAKQISQDEVTEMINQLNNVCVEIRMVWERAS